MRVRTILAATAASFLVACTGLGGGRALPTIDGAQSFGQTAVRHGGSISVLKTLKHQIVIGSTVASNGDQNPYGLVVGTTSMGDVKKGDLYVCNFNDKANVQGTGTTIVSLAPAPGSKPQAFSTSKSLLGCAALTMGLESGTLYAAAYGSKSEAEVSTKGAYAKSYDKGLTRPWGTALAVSTALDYDYATLALFVSDAWTGSIVLAEYCAGLGSCTYPGTPVVTGFAVNHGKPGSILGPSGLTFDPTNCVKLEGKQTCGTLYVVDGVTNTVVAIHNALNLRNTNNKVPIVVGKSGTTFSGPDASWASKVYAGSPLDGPISAAVFYNHNLVVGNTLNPNGTNLLVELDPTTGTVLDTDNVDKGAAGALFGIVATGRNAATTKLYFNDDNANNLQVLEP